MTDLTLDRVRPKWQTVVRAHPVARPMAVAAHDATCPCGAEILEDEPIIAVGAVAEVDPDGSRRVDLTGVEWRCQRCAGAREVSDA